MTTFSGVRFTLPTNVLYDLTGASIRINFVKNPNNSTVSLVMSNINSKIDIVEPYSFDIVEQKITLRPDTYYWDCKITFSDGRIKNYIGGQWVICDIITE